MKGVRQADDPFVCFDAKPDKGFGLEFSDATGSRQGNASEEFVCSLFFPPTPLIVFLVARKKCVIPLSEPLDDHRPRLKGFKEVDVFGGPRGYRHRNSNTKSGYFLEKLIHINSCSLRSNGE